MNFDVSSSALSYNLQAISKVIASKNTVPILDCFLFYLEGEKRKLTIIASDMETRLEKALPHWKKLWGWTSAQALSYRPGHKPSGYSGIGERIVFYNSLFVCNV